MAVIKTDVSGFFQTFHQIMTQLEDKLADSTEDIAVQRLHTCVCMYVLFCLRGRLRNMLRMPGQFFTVIFQKRCVHVQIYRYAYLSPTHYFIVGFLTLCTIRGNLRANTRRTGGSTPGARLSCQCPARGM